MTERTYCDMLFEDQVGVYINAKIKLAVFDKPKIKKQHKLEPTSCGIRGMSVEVDVGDEDYVIGRMMGLPIDTGDEEEDMASSSYLFLQDVPIEKAVEIYCLTGEIRFKDIPSLIRSYEVANNYLSEVEQRKAYSPNFAGVPEEDVEKLTKFTDELRYAAEELRGRDIHNMALAELLQYAFASSIFDNGENDDQGLLIKSKKDEPVKDDNSLFGGFQR